MKKSLVFILILLIFPIVSSLDFDMKTNFSQGETFLAKISGDFSKSIAEQDITFYRRHMQTSLIPEIIEINKEIYIYASLYEKIPDNYSIIVGEDSRNFTITDEIADFSINPGFIITSKDFSVEVKNLQNSQITIKHNFHDDEDSLALDLGETKKINFEIEEIEQTTLENLELSTEKLKYEIPVYIFVTLAETAETPIENNISETQEEETIVQKPANITAVSTTQTCEEMQGKVCGKGEACDGESAYAKDNVCCFGTCNEIESDDGWKLLGWAMLILIIIIILIVKRRYKNVKSNIDLLKIASGKR